MSWCCSYLNCETSRYKNKNLSFLKFPIKDVDKCKQWIDNCGNKSLKSLKTDELMKKCICERHFESTAFFNPNAMIKRLRHWAVPVPVNFIKVDFCEDPLDVVPSLNVKQPIKTYSIKRRAPPELSGNSQAPKIMKYASSERQLTTSSSCSSEEEEIKCNPSFFNGTPRKVKRKIVQRRKLTRMSSQKIRRIQNRRKFLMKRLQPNLQSMSTAAMTLVRMQSKEGSNQKWSFPESMSTAAMTLVRMQCKEESNQTWSLAERKLTLSLYHKSPSTYEYLYRDLKFTLPEITTVSRWLKINYLRTGVDTVMIKKLVHKIKTMTTSEKRCIVMFEQISLQPGLELNLKFGYVEGFEDLARLGRTDKIATHATVFYLRGLQHSWKMPFCYFLNETLSARILKQFILQVLKKLLSIDLMPKMLVCDENSVNRSVFNLLRITEQQPYLTFNRHKIFACYDLPNLIINLRNTFSNTNLIFIVEGKPVNWNDIVNTYEINCKSEIGRSLMKLTNSHINPNKVERTKLKLAAQLFSNTVHLAIYRASQTGQLKNDSANSTAEFLKKINDVYDCLTGLCVSDPNPLKCGLSISNDRIEDILKSSILWLKSIIVQNSRSAQLKNNIYCIDGLILTINSILNLWSDLVSKHKKIKYLLTGRINLDSLRNAFEVMQRHGGYSTRPTCKQFRLALQHDMQIKLQEAMDAVTCNFEEDISLEFSDDFADNNENVVCDLTQEASSPKAEEELEEDEDLQTAGITYVAGYLIAFFLQQHDCATCTTFMCDGNKVLTNKDLLIKYQDYGIDKSSPLSDVKCLKKPSELFVNLVNTCLIKFSLYYNTNKYVLNFYEKLLNFVLNESSINLISEDYCKDHMKVVLKQFLYVKLLKSVKSESAKGIMDSQNMQQPPETQFTPMIKVKNFAKINNCKFEILSLK